ncbi:MAG TPA: sigma-70 family RNA polymerase sigma factor [Candidatus Angelobacter sp.]
MSYDSQDTCELIRACADPRNSAAWQEFIRRFHKLIAGVAMRTCARWGEYSGGAADDLVQDTYLKLCADNCRLLLEFQGPHPDAIFGFIKVVTANIVNDHFRALHAEKRGGGVNPEDINSVQCATDCDQSGSLSAIQRAVLLGEIDHCLERCTQGESGERDRLIFRLYYGPCGFSAKDIAALPDVKLTVKGVESAILRITRLVRADVNRQAKEKAKAQAATAEKGISEEKPSLKGESD